MSNSVVNSLVSIFNVAIASAYSDILAPGAAVIPIQPKQEKFGDYQCNSAMPIAGVYKGISNENVFRFFYQNVVFWPKFRFLTKISIFDENFRSKITIVRQKKIYFSRKFRLSTKILIFDKIFDF